MIDLFFGSALFLVLLTESSLSRIAHAQYYHKTVPRFCEIDSECDTRSGERCYWMYQGCTKGQCMCNPDSHEKGPEGFCRTARAGGEYCTADDLCRDGMRCLGNMCTCVRGQMSPDRQFCLLPNHRLLGQQCEPHFTKCLHRASYGYTDNDIDCSYRGECECRDGYKPDGISCRKWGIGEYGCKRAFHCEGGAVCVDDRCVCPNGYLPTASNTKCAKRGAITNLPVGSSCNEIDERKYCGHGLVCHRCDGHHRSICVKFLLDTRWARQTGSGSHVARITTLSLILTLLSHHVLGWTR